MAPHADDNPKKDMGVKTPAPTGRPPAGGTERITPAVAEIRARLAQIAATEAALRQREQELERRQQDFQGQVRAAARRSLAKAQDRLAQRSGELDAQAVELTARAARLEEIEQRLADRDSAQERTQQELDRAIQQVRQHREAHQKGREQDHQALGRRIAVIRHHEHELERRLTRAHQDIQQQRADLEQQRKALDGQAADLEERARALDARRRAVRRDSAAAEARGAELEALAAELRAARSRLGQRRTRLKKASDQLKKARQELADRQRAQAEQWQQARDERHELARQSEDVDARRRTMREQQVTLKQRQRRLKSYDEQLRGRATALEAEAQRLADLESQVAQHKSAADDLHRAAEEAVRAAERRAAEAASLRDQAEARDAESRQTLLALELDQEQLEKEQAELARAQEELAGRQAQHETRLEGVRRKLAARADEIRQAERSLWAGPRRWWLRSAGLAVVAGLLAAVAWFDWQRPVYRASSELRIVGEPASADAVLAAHARRLRMPQVIEQTLADAELVDAWRASWAADDCRIVAATDRPAIEVTIDGTDADLLRRLVGRMCSGYGQSLRDNPSAPELTAEQSAELERLARESQRRRRRRDEQQDLLGRLAEPSERDGLRAAVGRSRAEFDELGHTLDEERARLSALVTEPVPGGSVAPADVERELKTDEMYLEDVKESRAAAKEYHGELVGALLRVQDPVRDLRRVLGGMADVLAEQRELQPPPIVAAVLEECTQQVGNLDRRLAAFAPQWQSAVDALQGWDVEQDVVELVKRQVTAAEQVGTLSAAVQTLVTWMRARLDRLAEESSGGTREVVVAVRLRGELGKLADAAQTMAGAAENTSLAGNFRLDACDRRIRGLRARLNQRQATVQQRLQVEADERARREHEARIATVRQAVDELEPQRAALLMQLADQLDELRRLDGEVARRMELEEIVRQCDAAIAELEQQAERREQQRDARRAELAATRLEAGSVQVEIISGAQRARNAVLAGAAVFAATGVVCLLMIVRGPGRRVTRWDDVVADLAAPPGAEAAARDESAV